MSDEVARTGRVIAVCYSQELINGVAKEEREEAFVTRWGIPGDRHYGETRYSESAGRQVANDRPVTVVGAEAGRGASLRLGVPEIPNGGLGENILLEGLGDLGDLIPGDRLRLTGPDGAPGPVLEVRQQNVPCSNLMIYHKRMPKELYGRRGVVCTVLNEGSVRRGDTAELLRTRAG